MFARAYHRRSPTGLLALAAACALGAGCAGFPRIDPTGERFLIWPKDQPPATAFPVAGGNLVAPPVGTDPVFPPPTVAPVAQAAPGVVAPIVAPVAVAQPPVDKLTMTQQRVLAPVNSEVVLKSAICTTEGFTLADQKIEWMLGREGVGQFVETSGKGLFHPAVLPWLKGRKIDNYLATGYTASGPLCISRGTADPSDDVNILRGDAWVSVTSPNEGVSYVTSFAPSLASWNDRRANAVIYWVDVQWAFPPPAVAGSGRSEVLSTTVTRQTNGTPIEGWIVRYQVNDGGSFVGSSTGQAVEVRTGADGKASVEVTPTASGAASSRVDVQLIRPAGFGRGDAPRLIVGSGSTVVQWGGGTPYLPPSNAVPTPAGPLPGAAPATPMPTLPPGTRFPSTAPGPLSGASPAAPMPTLPPATSIPSAPQPGSTSPSAPAGTGSVPAIPAQRARLDVEIRGNQTAQVGGQYTFEVTIRNSGNAPATNLVLNDRFQKGFSHLADPSRNLNIEKNLGSLAAGQSIVERLTFDVLEAGQLCHDVAVRYAESTTPATARACINATQPAPQRNAAMKIEKVGPQVGAVGETALFTVTVRNTGEVPLVNIEVIDEYPTPTLQVRPTEQNVQVVSGTIRRVIDRLEVGQSKKFDVNCVCLQPTREAHTLVHAKGQSDPPSSSPIETAAEHNMEIRPARTAATPGGPTLGTADGSSTLSLQTQFFNRPARAGARATCQITLANTAATPDEQVQLVVTFPPELTPDASVVKPPPNVQHEVVGNELRFSPIAMLRPGEPATYLIPMNANQPGVVELAARAMSRNVPRGTSRTDSLEILSR